MLDVDALDDRQCRAISDSVHVIARAFPQTYAGGIHLVRVTNDDREKQLWVAAAPREDAVALVLGAAPEGWSAALNMRLGDVGELAI